MSGPGGLRYQPDERPPVALAFGLGVQIAVLTLAAIILVPTIVMRAAGASEGYLSWAVFASVAICGVATILQSVRFGWIGTGHLVVVAASAAFISVGISAVLAGGPARMPVKRRKRYPAGVPGKLAGGKRCAATACAATAAAQDHGAGAEAAKGAACRDRAAPPFLSHHRVDVGGGFCRASRRASPSVRQSRRKVGERSRNRYDSFGNRLKFRKKIHSI